MRAIPKAKWESGVDHELRFWEQWLSTGGGEWPEDFERRMDPTAPLVIDGTYVQVPTTGAYRVLDVGSGPITPVGKRLPDVAVELTAVDPLAVEYDRLLDRLGIVPPVRTLLGSAEELVASLGRERFDLVLCSNALDHSLDPLSALQEMVDVTRPGGDVLLYHRIDEGENEGYQGFHSWNFRAEEGRFVIWAGDERVQPDTRLRDVERMIAATEGDWVAAHIRKAA